MARIMAGNVELQEDDDAGVEAKSGDDPGKSGTMTPADPKPVLFILW